VITEDSEYFLQSRKREEDGVQSFPFFNARQGDCFHLVEYDADGKFLQISGDRRIFQVLE
jgi:hypothetical protein